VHVRCALSWVLKVAGDGHSYSANLTATWQASQSFALDASMPFL
jgi:hypothetical protein